MMGPPDRADYIPQARVLFGTGQADRARTRRPAGAQPQIPSPPLFFASPRERHLEQRAAFLGEIDADARVDAALLVEEAARASAREHALVPDIGMHVEPGAAVEPEGPEVLGLHVVAGQRHRHDERLALEREEELAAVGVVVRVPEQDAGRRRACRSAYRGRAG